MGDEPTTAAGVRVVSNSSAPVPSLSQGGLLRALKQGGPRAAKAIMTLHRRYYHMPATPLRTMLQVAGCPDSVVAAVKDVLSKCRLCRTWELPEAKPVARSELALEVNKLLHADILYYARLNNTVGKLLQIFHMLDDASRWRMLDLVQQRVMQEFKDCISKWIGIFGPPERIKIDREVGLTEVNEMKIWLEAKGTRLDPLPSATGNTPASHTAAGVIEGNNRVLRKVLHKIETAAIEMNVNLTDIELLQEAQWCCNAVPSRDGVTASQAALGHLPRDPLFNHRLTGTQCSDPRSLFLERMRLRCVGMQAVMEANVTDRLERTLSARTRIGAVGDEGPCKYKEGDQLEVWGDPKAKDLPGWRGPATCVAANRQSEGRITVEWQGGTRECPLAEVRPFVVEAWWGGSTGGSLVTLCLLIDAQGSCTSLE